MDKTPRHLHIDPLGGIAGDMFLAAVLNAHPELVDEAVALAASVGPGIGLSLQDDRRKGIAGNRITLNLPDTTRGPRHYPDYVALLKDVSPDPETESRALDILKRLGTAEAQVHGSPSTRFTSTKSPTGIPLPTSCWRPGPCRG